VARQSREPVEYGDQVYLPVSISSLLPESVPRFDLYFRPGPEQPFVLYCERNTAFAEEARQRLLNNRIDHVFIRQSQRHEYTRYLAENIATILEDKSLSPRQKSAILYDSAQAVVEDILSEPKSRENIGRGKHIVRHTVDFMSGQSFKLENLLRSISSDYYLYTHSVNVTAYSIALATRAGFTDAATLRELANGALLHDIGKSTVPRELLNKDTALTASEWKRMKDTPRAGYNMLAEMDCVGEVALDIVLHHRERINGLGYPDGIDEKGLSPFVRIVAIADVFDALTTDRHHQKAKSTFEALRIMNGTMRQELDAELLRKFVELMGNR
jgi:HD-GYP domain-containing protein (c-di-GMP phosphodiesterase class II)